jgi:2Fe-2S ferredoxin
VTRRSSGRDPSSFIVRVEPLGAEMLRAGEAPAEAAWRLGYRWPTACLGPGRVHALPGDPRRRRGAVVPPDEEENEAIRVRLPSPLRRPGVRLACRLRVS